MKQSAQLYIARAVIDGGYHPGKARKNGDGFIPYGGVERVIKDYEVLTSNPVATITAGTYHIRSQIENKPMDVVNGQNANGNGLHLWDFHGGDAQQFTIERSNEAGYYYIKTNGVEFGYKRLEWCFWRNTIYMGFSWWR
ncbi:MAG: DUF3421 domain-containing protein [Saprospiraceae bacterium]|nr:DUF3421 domain-containing protein [Saprospiraceae bacterium]